MAPPDFPNAAPLWPDAGKPPSQGKTLIGGVPWADQGSGAAPAPAPVAPEFAGLARATQSEKSAERAARAIGVPRGQSAGSLALEQLSWPAIQAAIARWFHEQVLGTPAWTISLGVHLVLLLALALFVVHEHHGKKLRLNLSFAGPVGAEAPGVAIAPAAEKPRDNPKKDEVDTPVETPTTVAKAPEKSMDTPLVAEPVTKPADAGSAAPPAMRAPAVGTLLAGRDAGRREALVGAGGGSDATEAAVNASLDWIVRQVSKRDGLWSLTGPYADGGAQENRLAASAMALIALQGAGNTPAAGKHQAVVARAWKSLLRKQQENGSFDVGDLPIQQGLYAHAQVTIALCEAFGMTRDPALADPATRAVAYAVAAQGPDGGWRYEPGQAGDMSVTGWFMMALKSGEMAGLEVPPATFERLGGFLDFVMDERGVRYGYQRHSALRPPSPITPAVTAEGLLCRQYLGWAQDDPRLVQGVEMLLVENKLDFANAKDVYAWYYITQVAHHMEGEPWQRWNESLRQVLPMEQVRSGRERGSWDPALDRWGHAGGRLYVTALCTWMLEVYYRHLPIYARGQGAAAP